MTPEDFFAAEARQRPVERWGETDCVSTICRWVEAVCGVDLKAVAGLAWTSEAEAEAIMAERAMPIRIARAMRSVGIPATSHPRPGDVGVVVAGPRVIAAVRGSAFWLARDETGFMGAPLALRRIGAWRLP